MTYTGPYSMSLGDVNDTRPKVNRAPIIPSHSLLGELKRRCPAYFDVVVRSGLQRKYIEGQYTVFVPSVIPPYYDRQTAYTFCGSTTVKGKIDPLTLDSSSSMVIDTLNPTIYIGTPQSINVAVECSNGWIYILK